MVRARMMLMSRFSWPRDLAVWPVLVALLPLACSRPFDTARADNQNLRPDSSLPFRDSQSLPSGTLITVRLKSLIAADGSGFSGAFDAIVDEPVLVEGSALLPRGASVAGRVESARASGLRRNRGYVRLRLESVNVGGRNLPIQTSSLFVRGSASETPASGGTPSPQVVRLEGGRRLTFRLAEPVSIPNSPDMPIH